MRRHSDTSEPAQQRAAEAPLGAAAPTSTQGFLSSSGHASSAAVWRRLKAFSQHGAWSRRPSRRKLTVPLCRLRHRPRLLVLLQTGPRHQARGPRREHQGQAGERPPFSTLRARPYEHPFSCCARAENQFLPQRVAGGMAPGGGRRRQGASPIQSQRICLMLPKHMTALRQGVAPRAPEVSLNCIIQHHLGSSGDHSLPKSCHMLR